MDRLSFSGNDTYALPRVYLEAGSYHFSFSGLKSAVINLVHQALNRGEEIRKEDLCASFQAAVSQVLVDKTFALAKEKNVQQIIVAGGVSANQGLKERFMKENPGFEICIPSIRYCTDNAAMIAVAGYYQYRKTKQASDFSMNADASLELSY